MKKNSEDKEDVTVRRMEIPLTVCTLPAISLLFYKFIMK